MKSTLQEGLSLYRVDPEVLRELQPDVIVTQTQCEVCAVSIDDVEEALAEAIGMRPEIVSLTAEALDGIWADIARVAKALDVEGEGERVVAELRERMATVSESANAQKAKPSICCIEWIEPLMGGGNWIPELVAMAGGVGTHGEAGKHSPYFDWDTLVKADPDVIAIFPCGYDIAKAKENMHFLTERAEWASLKAVRDGRVYIADGNQYFNRPGPRIADSLEILAEILHPDVFSYGNKVPYLEQVGVS